MKKGFTIIEIILSLVIIMIIGTGTTFLVVKNNSKKIEDITKQVLEAANLFINLEKDDAGNIYNHEIKNVKKGVKIPLANLVNKGYITDETKEEIISLSNKGAEFDYYIMFLDGNEEETDYCGDGSIVSLASWLDNDRDKVVYLCNKSGNPGSTGDEEDLIAHIFSEYDEGEIGQYNCYYLNSKIYFDRINYCDFSTLGSIGWDGVQHSVIRPVDNGLIKVNFYKSNGNIYDISYRYRGEVGNNYLIIPDNSGYNILYRIMGMNGNYILLTTEKSLGNIFDTDSNKTLNDLKTLFYDIYREEAFLPVFHSGPPVRALYKEDLDVIGFSNYSDNVNNTYNINYFSSGDSTIFIEKCYYEEDDCSLHIRTMYNANDSKDGYLHYGSYNRNYDYVYEDEDFMEYKISEFRPVISINNSWIKFTGKGTITDPYIITPK